MLASSVANAAGAVLVPAIDGLGAPHWRDDVRARLIGVSSGFDRRHLARAIFDAIAWSLRDVLAAIEAAKLSPTELRVDGGLTNSALLLQRCADCCGIPLRRARQSEASTSEPHQMHVGKERLLTRASPDSEQARHGRMAECICPYRASGGR